MAVLWESFDDSYGIYPNKKQKALEKKRKEEEDHRNKKLKEKVVYSLPIPHDLTTTWLARVRRYHYPALSLVTGDFRRLIASPKLYDVRTKNSFTESVLYACIAFPPFKNPSWYILNRKPYRNLPNTLSLSLRKINTLPSIPCGSAVVTIGSNIYVIGGCSGDARTSSVTLIDCKSHKHYTLENMKNPRCRPAAGVVDGKIYVIGGCEMVYCSSDWIEVFDVENQTWSPVPGQYPVRITNTIVKGKFLTSAVMNEKIYCLDMIGKCYVYDPREGKWDDLEQGVSMFLWNESSCVIDQKLFSINPLMHMNKITINVYDPEQKTWSPLKGLQGFPQNMILRRDNYIIHLEAKLANFGGKLVILGPDMSTRYQYDFNKREIWYTEIAWERRENGGFWGKVESVAVVLTPPKPTSVEFCRTVTV